jgi:tetratricopeptide (TPR) repeat protein
MSPVLQDTLKDGSGGNGAPAKQPHHARADVSDLRLAEGTLETAIGEVTGTPAYMPPEQAGGDAVDERADVYAIGAMLMHVLTGSAPYEGRSALEVLEAVRHAPPPSIRERARDVPADLIAIVERAMARDAVDRYPTARELAEDLRKFQTGQLVGAYRYSLGLLLRRWIKRHRAVLAVAAIAFVVVGAVGVLSVRRVLLERERADEQRIVAEHSEHQAEDLTDFMLGDMREKLEPLGKLELLEVVARKALTYYGDGTGSGDLAQRATAMVNIGDVLTARGDQAAAHASYGKALGLRLAHAIAVPGDDDAQAALSDSYLKLGEVTRAQGNSAGALALYDAALAISELHLSRAPRWSVAFIVGQLGAAAVVDVAGNLAGAQQRLEAALKVMLELEATKPGDSEYAGLHARVFNQLASVLVARSRLVEALERRQAALEILETLTANDPTNARLLVAIASTASALGHELEMANQPTAQPAMLQRAVAAYVVLVARDPSNAKWRGELVDAHVQLGRKLGLDDRGNAGSASFAAAETLATESRSATRPTPMHCGGSVPCMSSAHAPTSMAVARSPRTTMARRRQQQRRQSPSSGSRSSCWGAGRGSM